jgi:hypothetical protein
MHGTGTLVGWVGGDCADEIQMTCIQEFTSLDRDPLVDGTESSDRTDFEF